jgi:hypothetical protein
MREQIPMEINQETLSKELENEFTLHFNGLKSKIASNTTAGLEKIKTGKDPMAFGLYQSVCQKLLKHPSKEMIFTRTFLIIFCIDVPIKQCL